MYILMKQCKEVYGEKKALVMNTKKGLFEKNFIELFDDCEAIAKFIQTKFGKTHIALFGKDTASYIIFYTAIMMSESLCVPVDIAQDDEDLEYVMNHCDAQVCFYGEKQKAKIEGLKDKLPNIKEYICYDEMMEEFIAQGKKIDCDLSGTDEENTAVIIYTSGTTGKPKGVMLSQKNVTAVAGGAGKHVDVYESVLSVLPLHHSYGSMCGVYSIFSLGKVVYVSRGLKYIMKELNQFSPTNLFVVPLFVTTFEKQIKKALADKGMEKTVYNLIKFSNGLKKIGINLSRKFFKSIIDSFGGKLRVITSGGASIDTETEKFFDSMGIIVSGRYGITECAPLVAVNKNLEKKVGSVGRALPYCKVRIDNPDENGNGEICVFGDNVMQGYYKNEEATKAAFTEDGWFRTGDIGYLDSDGFVFINGRIKNLIILNNGKNINPEELEDKLLRIPLISEVIVGTVDNEKLEAEIYLNPDNAGTKEEVLSKLEEEIEAFNKQQPYYKRISKTVIRKEEFEKTSTKKIKRFAPANKL